MKVLCYDLHSGVAGKAAEQLGYEFVGYLQRKPKSEDSRRFSVADKVLGSIQRIPRADILLTCAPTHDFNLVKDVVKASNVSFVIWCVGALPPETRKEVNAGIIPLQMLDYDTTVLKNVSVHTLGYNYIEDRTFIIATNDKREMLMPKLKILYPEATLEDICNTSKDEVFEKFEGNKQIFHKEPRPWNYVSEPKDDFRLFAHRLGVKLGSVLYLVNNKVHRIAPDEACQMVGNPAGFEDLVTPHCESPGQATFAILSEPGLPVWVDLMERTCYANN